MILDSGEGDDNMETETQEWVDRAQYDLDTARAMLVSGRYLYVVFCCQQAIEKALKAVIVERSGEFPPRTHNLLRLAELSGVEIAVEQSSLLKNLSDYYVKSRYPESAQALTSTLTQQSAREVLRKTEDTVEWLFSMLK
jgi:HEPN domain-containing protein